MTVTYQQFADFLLKHSCFYYRPHETVYCYIREDGSVRFFANWGYGETRDYASLKALMEATTGRDLPDAEDLAEQEDVGCTDMVAVNLSALRTVLDYLHESEAESYADTVETYPEAVNNHVYRHVLAIEAKLAPRAKAGAK